MHGAEAGCKEPPITSNWTSSFPDLLLSFVYLHFPPMFFPLISSNGSFTESEIPRAMSSRSHWRAAELGTR